MDGEMLDRLREIFRGVFQLEAGADVNGFCQEGNERWDSMAHVLLVAAMENEFGIRIDLGEALRMKSFEAAHGLLTKKIEAPA